ncbi:MAG: CotH kinase family protein [Bacteroidaceae bacterium]|nr:CotH kinase family protein [Bacteroidaceae bacterium]
MKINPKKETLLSLIVVILLLFAVMAFSIRDSRRVPQEKHDLVELSLAFVQGSETDYCIHPFSTDSGYVIVFPAGWDINDTYMVHSDLLKSEDEDDPLSEEMYNERPNDKVEFMLNHPTKLDLSAIGIKKQITITPFQSKLAAIFIDTDSDTMNEINHSRDKSHEESGKIQIFDSIGDLRYKGQLDEIKGHGSSSWQIAQKKSYGIKLKDKVSFLGLNASKSFYLISNAFDPSHIRNWLMGRVSQLMKMPQTIKSEHVAVYLNGHYNGLYQITNKRGIGKDVVNIHDLETETEKLNSNKLKDFPRFSVNRNDTIGLLKGIQGAINPKDITDGYLMEINFKHGRYREKISGFIPKSGMFVDLISPKYATKEQILYISDFYNNMMEAILSEDGINHVTGKSYLDYIDLDSFVKYYLIQETFMNNDAGVASLYLFKHGNKMYASPLWDADLSLGTHNYFERSRQYNMFWTARDEYSIFGGLYSKPEFMERLLNLYNEELMPLLSSNEFHEELIKKYNSLSHDILLNNKKNTPDQIQRGHGFTNNIAKEYEKRIKADEITVITDFLNRRLELLSELWSVDNGEDQFVTIKIYDLENGQKSLQYAYMAKKNSVFKLWEPFCGLDNGATFDGYYSESGEKIDSVFVSDDNITLYAKYSMK